MVVIAGDARLLSFGRRDASAEVDRLYRRHADEVLRYVLLVLRSRADAEDVVQATFVRAFRALSRGERVYKPRNWLIKIAHNECRRTLATRARRAVEVELGDVPVEQVETGRAESLRAALAQLAPNQREALVLRELEGRSYNEIAASLEVSESAVETLLFRARRAVREQLDDVLGCETAYELIERETLSGDERRLLRAHTRACSECATAERRARGRKGALRRIASSLGLPGFSKTLLAKVLGVAVSASAVGIAGVAIADRPAPRLPDVVPLQVDRAEISPVVAPQPVPAHERVRAAVVPAARAHTGTHRTRRAGTASAPGAALPAAAAAPAAPPPAVASPASEPAATSGAAPAPAAAAKPVLPLPASPVSTIPVPALPSVSMPQLPQPSLPLPSVDPPALPVAAPVPVALPVELPVPTPQVPPLLGVK